MTQGQPAAAVTSALDHVTSATGELTRDEILDNITLYWLTNTGVSASRLYWEYKGGFFNTKGVAIPVAVSVFPGEQYQAPRSWTEQAYPNLIHYNQLDRGGHFAAWSSRNCFQKRSVPGFGRWLGASDGNKRLAWAAAVTFLALSGHPVRDLDVGAAEAFMISVASGKLADVAEIDGYYAISMLCRWNDAPHRNRPPPRLPAAAQEGSLAQAIAAAYDLELQLSTRRTTTSSTSLMPRTPTGTATTAPTAGPAPSAQPELVNTPTDWRPSNRLARSRAVRVGVCVDGSRPVPRARY